MCFTPTCAFCDLEPKTIEHLYFQCIYVKDIWLYVFEEWVAERERITLMRVPKLQKQSKIPM